jgi:LysM repeat protein
MPWHSIRIVSIFILAATFALTIVSHSHAGPGKMPYAAGSPFDLINAVNALRASYGLAPYSISPILMFTAQSQAEFMAATGDVSHTGFGGSSLTDRLLAAGYPLAGDLSLGGFRAENITSGKDDRSAQSAVDGWTGDALHLDTMVSPNLSEIGAGVAIANGRVYYVIDAALPITGPALPASTIIAGSVPTSPPPETSISAAVISTPNLEGDVIHEVQVGQSLWQIAIAYEVTIDEIKRLNNIVDDSIYPGSKLLIKTDGVVTVMTTVSVTAVQASSPTAMLASTVSPATSASLETPVSGTFTPSAIAETIAVDNTSIMRMAIGIIVLALLGGGVFTWLGRTKKE